MNVFDQSILQYLNGFAHRSAYFDHFLACIESNDLFKGGMVIPILWWLWFRNKEDDQTREHVVSTLIASLAALLVARGLALLLPFRIRPIYNASLHLIVPYGVNPQILEGWSAFPSDHAVFFFALATGIFQVSRKVGYPVLLYTVLAICLPRIYFGFHHPTDIIAGALLGSAAAGIAGSEKFRKKVTHRILHCERERPDLFYTCSFLLTFQMMVLFNSIRDLGHRFFSLF
jgi:undecaprenyl-diphosphatase